VISSMFLPKTLAVVLPRYGKSLGGGAEALTKTLIEHLPRVSRDGFGLERLEVWTTCAIDHRSWSNALPAGWSEEDGVRVCRFPVDERNVDIFLRAEIAMRDGKRLTVDEQLDWMENSVNSRALYSHLCQHKGEFEAIIFAPYLFATTFWGAMMATERAILIPCLHNEHYAYLEIIREMFASAKGIIFNAGPEGELAERLYSIPGLSTKSAVVGMGFELKNLPPAQTSAAPYLLYSGRKEQGKNLDLLLNLFARYRERNRNSKLELRLIGSGTIEFLKELPSGVKDLGFVSEEEKASLMSGALALCQPSVNESFSIVVMEAWLYGTPVIVHGRCDVTRDHVLRSGGGLYFSNEEEFFEVLDTLLEETQLRNFLGRSGKRFVEREYAWNAVLARLSELFQKLGYSDAVGTKQTSAG
jgi:glycosyltransferase involved in cell wall biosynthesis